MMETKPRSSGYVALHLCIDAFELGNELSMRVMERTGANRAATRFIFRALRKVAPNPLLTNAAIDQLVARGEKNTRQTFEDLTKVLRLHVDNGSEGMLSSLLEVMKAQADRGFTQAVEVMSEQHVGQVTEEVWTPEVAAAHAATAETH